MEKYPSYYIDKIEIAKEVLREMGVSSYEYNEQDEYFVDTDEDHVINAMLVFLDRVNNKQVEK